MGSQKDHDAQCTAVGEILLDKQRPMAERFRALFTLRNLGGEISIKSISGCFDHPSELLKHECAYVLGQMQDERALPVLAEVLADKNQETIVRHEAGEAIGAIGSLSMLDVLEQYRNDADVEVAETCQLAVERLKWLHNKESDAAQLPKNPYSSVDPAPPCVDMDTSALRDVLLDESKSLFERYRAMFTLRNCGDEQSVLALAEGLKCSSALFRHEIAFVLGQIQHPAGTAQLSVNLVDPKESSMVRHECAEALGSIATDECVQILQKYSADQAQVVRESVEVALDMADHEVSGHLEYADGLDRVTSS